MTFICYPKCTTCQKAQKWLDENGISYTFRDIKMENPTYEGLHGIGAAGCRSRNSSTPAVFSISPWR